MRSVIYGLVICSFCAAISSAKIAESKKFGGLNGKVKEVTKKNWVYRKNRLGLREKQYDGRTVTCFDINGCRTDWTYYTADDSVRTQYSYKNNEKGDAIENNLYDAYEKKHTKTTYQYDYVNSYVIEKEYYEDGWVINRTKSVYDDNGNLKEKIRYYVVDKPVVIDEEDEEQKKIIADKDRDLDKVFAKTIYKYDDKGNKIEIIELDMDDNSAFERTTYTYRDNKLVMMEFYKRNKLNNREKYKYDKKGNMLEKESYNPETNKKTYSTKYFYNTENLLIREEQYSVHGGFAYSINGKTTYKYDSHGNVTEILNYIDGKLFTISLHQYVYY